MSSCDVDKGTSLYNLKCSVSLNLRADGEQDALNKLDKLLGEDGIILDKTPRIQLISTKKG